MCKYLNNFQLSKLKEVLHNNLDTEVKKEINYLDYVENYINSKKLEGLSDLTLKNYKATLYKLLKYLDKNIKTITTEDIRDFLSYYQSLNNCGNHTLENIRLTLSSFFNWLENEDIIIKSPVKRIHKIKVDKIIKETYTDEEIEKMRRGCKNIRNLAILDLLISSGVRVGELIRIDVNDLDLNNMTCKVFGKGNKEREVYFDSRTKLHLQEYLSIRTDNDSSLFVTNIRPYKRLGTRGVELMLQKLAKQVGIIKKVYPHKFRRTLATRAIDKGMPIEQVQKLLGHTKIDTTLHYAMVNQSNVKLSHRKYIC